MGSPKDDRGDVVVAFVPLCDTKERVLLLREVR